MTNDLARVVNDKEKRKKENLLDYVKRFKQLRDVATNQLGRLFLHKFVEMKSEYWDLTDPQSQ